MIPASTYLPRTISSTIAASSIHGTGAQNLSSALRSGCNAVSGMAFGPDFAKRLLASVLVRPEYWANALLILIQMLSEFLVSAVRRQSHQSMTQTVTSRE